MSSFRQVAVADLTIINKTDLVNEEELTQIRAAIRSALLAFFVVIFPFYYSIGFFYAINQPLIRSFSVALWWPTGVIQKVPSEKDLFSSFWLSYCLTIKYFR